MSSIPLRRCSSCDRTDLTDADFYVANKRTGRLMTRCKTCHNAVSVAWQKAHPERVSALQKRHRSTDAYKQQAREREQRPEIKAVRAAYKKTAANKASGARYRETHAASIKAYNAAHYAIHKERLRAAAQADYQRKRAHYAALSSAWKKANKDKVNSYTHKRRYALRGTWTDVDWQRLKAQWDWRCALCGQQEITDGIILCFDHIVPVSRGGWNIISNAQPLCRRCNSKKHRRVLVLRR